ncbi:nicotinate-nucleotide adenylyltransferase [Wielerella bovis]|uniref:nicotinate-nucleotide adenylyltransferase n=1 Tax=Wielerella bovis TaxID=2917790 RepID=UPI0020185AB2|nr:nicotinate-nucleotide adenylyltransferase [Wielerella bovis]ULJ62461.1 nicotinate-nucleotide adenylyltransferase [Wielerella bovis]
MKLGLFGGSFDPIHKGHLHIAHAFAEELALDTVVFLPAGDPYHKQGERVAAKHRLAMVEVAIADKPHFAASDLDMVREGATYSVDTVQIFKQHYPKDELWWLLGMDSLLQLHTWKNWQTFVRQTHIAVAARAGQNLMSAPPELRDWLGDALQKGSLKILSAPLYDVSSTQIRAELAKGKKADEWLPETVADYITREKLYR